MLRKIFRRRKYKSGTTWCFWRWTDVDSEYITRLHVLKTPWFAICLHWLNKPDPEPYLHDHPVSFLSVILRGGYGEKRQVGDEPMKLRVNRWFNWIRATPEDRHTIVAVKPNTLTLCFMGKKTREWGFHIPGAYPNGDRWMMWKDYYAEQRAGRQRVRKTGEVTMNTLGFVPGMELATSDGKRYTVIKVKTTTLTIARSTWWRRLWFRIRRWFR